MEAGMAAYAFVVLKYKVPLDRVEQTTPRHRAYLTELHKQGKLLASGAFVPRDGGGLLLRVEGKEEMDRLLAKDPYQVEGLVETTIHWWAPGIGVAGLDALPKQS
jgi:uncharacterized protein YciI